MIPLVRLRRLLGEEWSPQWSLVEAIEKACDEIEKLRSTAAPEGEAISDMWWRDALRERPHPKRLVIARTKEYGPVLADRTTRNPDFGWSCEGTVTHWMPLPPLPQRVPE